MNAKCEITPKQIAAALRARVLALKPQEIGIEPREADADTASSLFGVVIETAHPDVVTSLVALSDGSVSFYVSDGNGCIGCGANREVRAAAEELLQVARSTLPLAVPTTDVSLPEPGSIRFYLLTHSALKSVQTTLEEINAVDERLVRLYFAGQKTIAAFERVGAGQSLAQEIRRVTAAEPTLSVVPGEQKELTEQSCSHLATDGEDSQCLSVGNVVRRLRT